MHRTLSGLARHLRVKRIAVAASLAVVGLGSLAGAASANFTLSSGSIQLTAGATTGNPPTGSWVSLPTDQPPPPPPFPFPDHFINPSTSWTGTPTGLFTVIRSGISAGGNAPGLTLGTTQSGANSITGDTTDPFDRVAWYLYSRAETPTTETGWTPRLTFAGLATDTGARSLVSGDLRGLWVRYNGNDYYVGTDESTGLEPLTGQITGNAITGRTITLNWNTDLASPYAPGFEPFQARFQLVGRYR